LTLIPTRMAATWLQGQVAIRSGGLLKERLLYGALHVEPDEVRRHGAGHFIGQVIEAEAMESLALGGGFLTLVSSIELIASAAVAGFGTGSILIPGLLAACTVSCGLLLFQYFERCSEWTTTRLAMTHDLVERMVGHRTRLVQQPKEQWHEVEDQSLDSYHRASSRMDAFVPWLTASLPRAWLMIGLAGMAPGFIAGSASPEGLAARLGAIVLAFRAFKRLGVAAPQLIQALIAWKQTQPLIRTAQRKEPHGLPSLACAAARASTGDVVLDARDVVFRYGDRQEPVLRGCGLQIRAGDRILLDGPSGEGKSTLAAVIAGVRKPTSGLVLAGGLDRTSLGVQGWRRRVAATPQFHENHLITGPLAFNLLMGRQGTIRDTDVREAETVCEELGLGELLQRMPAGVMQMVGESGWQLSHGERSRVYLARAVLQNAQLVVLDESLAALDAVNLQRAIACIEKRAPAVLAIAHA
jgi:ATP-binding cassette subfamily B protein